jgi:hypothetical protein
MYNVPLFSFLHPPGTDLADLLGQLSVLGLSPLSSKTYFDMQLKRDMDYNKVWMFKRLMVSVNDERVACKWEWQTRDRL